MTILEAEKKFVDQLKDLYDPDEAKALAFLTVNHICNISRSGYLTGKNQTLAPVQQASIEFMLDEIKNGVPIQHIIGETDFYGLKFKVSSAVLIPRPETEELVDWILNDAKSKGPEPENILDIGTGSGCIAIALKKNLPGSIVSAIDMSADVLEVALKNAVLNKTEVKFIKEDILNPGSQFEGKIFDVIVSNPPYITPAEKMQMHVNVLEHEPHLALFVPADEPLLFYDRIADFALKYLSQSGQLYFEINENFGQQTAELLKSKGFNAVIIKADLMGKDRMIKASFN